MGIYSFVIAVLPNVEHIGVRDVYQFSGNEFVQGLRLKLVVLFQLRPIFACPMPTQVCPHLNESSLSIFYEKSGEQRFLLNELLQNTHSSNALKRTPRMMIGKYNFWKVACFGKLLLEAVSKEAMAVMEDGLYLVGADIDKGRIELLPKEVKGKDITELIPAGRERLVLVPSGGVGVAVAAGGVGVAWNWWRYRT
ncbi:uncharacterized protein LOC118485087 [Helianthus annuus]|uniref:uncharacterized protein LOC118485087 n=1 Tax=Helianthus annuus TaxID=4232 RepID=UPI0016532337|nr:uncharacterized protein LOC118485087 [Helianthus annuus]